MGTEVGGGGGGQPVGTEVGAEDGGRRAGTEVERVMRVRQVHGQVVRVLRRGEVPADAHEQTPEADALVADAPGLVLAVQVADCVPLLMADARTGAAGAVHAGWRGTAAGIAATTVETLSREFGVRPHELVVAIGPSIGPCCYDVGPELPDAFWREGATDEQLAAWFSRDQNNALRLDLWAANRDQLIDAGVPAANIHLAHLCTKTHAHLFDSYRADGPNAGRMAALIRVPSR